MKLFRHRTPATDLDDFDVAVGDPTDDPDELARALEAAGVEARVVVHEDAEPVVKIRADDVPGIQEALERQRH